MISRFEDQLAQLIRELDSIIKDMWYPDGTGDGFEPLIELNGWRDRLETLRMDMADIYFNQFKSNTSKRGDGK